jgi:hypothetical protein
MYELVPDDFEVPRGLEHDRFRLRMRRTSRACSAAPASTRRRPTTRARMWVRREAYEDGLDPVVEAALREWFGRDWPSERVDWAERA